MELPATSSAAHDAFHATPPARSPAAGASSLSAASPMTFSGTQPSSRGHKRPRESPSSSSPCPADEMTPISAKKRVTTPLSSRPRSPGEDLTNTLAARRQQQLHQRQLQLHSVKPAAMPTTSREMEVINTTTMASPLASQQRRRIRELEQDLTRMFRRQTQEADARARQHAAEIAVVKQQMETACMALEDRDAVERTTCMTDEMVSTTSVVETTAEEAEEEQEEQEATVTLSKMTAQEMDGFVASCVGWQAQLSTLTSRLQERASLVEQEAVRDTLVRVVEGVAMQQDQQELQHQHVRIAMEEDAIRAREQEMASFVAALVASRDAVDAFKEMEREVLEDSVNDLERQVREATRAAEAARVVDTERAEREEALNLRCEAQAVQLTLLREELATLVAEKEARGTAVGMQVQAVHPDEKEEKEIAREEEIQQLQKKVKELTEQLVFAASERDEMAMQVQEMEAEREQMKTSHTKRIEAIEHAEKERALQEETQRAEAKKEMQKLNQLAEMLQMNVAAKATVIADLSDERLALQHNLKAMKKDLVRFSEAHTAMVAKRDKWRLRAQELEREREELTSSHSDEMSQRVAELQQQVDMRTAREAEALQQVARVTEEQHELVNARESWQRREQDLESEIVKLKDARSELLAQHQRVAQEVEELHRANTTRHTEKEDLQVCKIIQEGMATATTENLTVGSVVDPRFANPPSKTDTEKRFLGEFWQCYFEKAEAKCQALMQHVAELEKQRDSHPLHAYESSQLLHP